ncbi:PAS domain-containing protein [Belnapia sp. T6]|uniref:histidine kinase n=1 Tax=Belnapia mucosa TaxID=2804532 RepID=A0ABS1UZI1_9PROT|nr:PAS domain-containing protein [Belnapia mucosa]MBL6454805.1 PAS domain-containing protein [Belnapia mucosa]
MPAGEHDFAAMAAAVLDAAPVAALLLAPGSATALAGNREAALLFGCPEEAVVEAWAHALREAPDLARRLTAVEAELRAEIFDARLPRQGLPPEAVLVRCRRITLAGRPVLTLGLVPVIRRRQAEEALAIAKQRLEVALAGADLGAWHWDAGTNCLEVTPRWAAMLGLPPPEGPLPLSAWEALVHPNDLPPTQARLAPMLKGRTDRYEAEFRMRHAAGHWVWIRARGQAVGRDAQGRVRAVAGTHFDLTEQRQAAAARAASEREARRRLTDLESLYRTAPLGLAQMDTELRFVRINEALADINGFPIEAHLGRRFWELLPDIRAAAEPLLRRVAETGETIRGAEISGETARAPGVQRDWIAQLYPLRDPETDEVTGIGIVCEEVTERRRSERARELLLRELDHRVKNLFAVIAGLVTYTARGAASPDSMHTMLLGRIQALAQAHDLVRPALGGALAMEEGGTAVQALATALMKPFRPGSLAAPGRVERVLLSGPPVRLGPTAAPPLALALHELATNAAKYGALSREAGQVTLSWSVQDAAEGNMLRLLWQERDGPATHQPGRTGFGHRLVTQSSGQLSGSAQFHWAEPGLTVELLLPMDRLGR